MKKKLERGSEWRKWDLQIQPIKDEWLKDPFNHKTNIKNSVRDFILKAIERDIEIIAITDHNCGYAIDLAFEYVSQNNLNITILPGVEIELPEGWHIVVIFNPEYKEKVNCDSWQETVQAFLRNIGGLNSFFDENGIYKQITSDTETFLTKIHSEDLGLTIFAHCDSTKGFFNRGNTATRKKILEGSLHRKYPLIFDTKEKTKKEIERNITNILNTQSCLFNFPVISTSDSHNTNSVGSKFSWIKADPTFEGLRQIIYEPKERVKVQPNNPEYENDKPYFESIQIDQSISVYEEESLKLKKLFLPLNKNLITIIGGRGEGKSTLINYLANIFNKYKYPSLENPSIFTQSSHFKTKYNKINSEDVNRVDILELIGSNKENNELEYIFIQQGALKERCFNTLSLSEEIKQMLGIKEPNFSTKLSEEILKTNQEIEQIEEWLEDKDEFGNSTHQENFQNEIIARNKTLLENLKNSKNKQKIETYNENLKLISSYKDTFNTAELIEDRIKTFLSELQELIAGDTEHFALPDLQIYQKTIFNIKQEIYKKIQEKEKENKKIKKDFDEVGIFEDITSLLENATKYQSNIDNAQKILKNIRIKKDSLKLLKGERAMLGVKIKGEYQRQSDAIDDAWNHFLDKHPKEKRKLIKKILLKKDTIGVSGRILFDKGEFYKMLGEAVNKRSYKDLKDLENQYSIKDIDSWVTYVEKEFNTHFDGLNQKKR